MASHQTCRIAAFPPCKLGRWSAPLFERLLAAGHGRVALDLQIQGLRDRAHLLERACSTNLAWDPQLENDRGPWLLRLLDLAGEPESWLEHLVGALPATQSEHDARQVAQILDRMAQRGESRARDALERERNRGRFGDEDVLGPWPACDPEDLDASYPREDSPSPTVDELNAVLNAGAHIDGVVERCVYMRVRVRAAELPFSEKALDLLRHEHPALRSYARSLIRRMRDPRLREEGLRTLRVSRFFGEVDSLLARNLEQGDTDLLERALPDVEDVESVHDACLSLTSLIPDSGDDRWRRISDWIYDWSPCQLCRPTAVDALARLDPAPELGREWSWDACGSVRMHARP